MEELGTRESEGSSSSSGDQNQRFWRTIMRIEGLIADNLRMNSGRPDYHKLRWILNDPDTKASLLFDLGVLGGAFALASMEYGKLFLLQDYRCPVEHVDIPVIEIPHQPERMKDIGELIDLLFMGRRSSQSLTSNDPPELYLHLPPEKPKIEFPMLFPEARLRKSEGYKFLYCTHGEVTFFCLIWRWLIRYAQGGNKERLEEVNAYTKWHSDSKYGNLWEAEFWKDADSSIESEWVKLVDECNTALETGQPISTLGRPLNEDELPFYRDALRQWYENAVPLDSEPETEDWTCDWQKLGILSKDRALKPAFYSLFRYVYFLSQDESLKNALDAEEGPIWEVQRARLSSIFRYFGKSPGKSRDESPIEAKRYIQELELFDEAARVLGLLTLRHVNLPKSRLPESEKPLNCFNLLRKLHALARFPIVPLYFWTALDPSRSPREHLVIPIAESNESPVKLGDDGLSRYVAFALLAVKPIWQMPSHGELATRPEFEKESDFSDLTLERLFRVYEFFATLGKPLLEKGYYGEIERMRWQIDAERDVYISQAHEIKNLVGLIRHDFPANGGPIPNFVLTEIRTYFNVIFAANQSDAWSLSQRQALPSKFGEGKNLRSLILNSAEIAARIETISRWSKGMLGGDSSSLSLRTEEAFANEVNELFLYVKPQLGDYGVELKDPAGHHENQRRFMFVSALICGLRNAFQHSMPRSELLIVVEMFRGKLRLCIRNKRKSVQAGLLGESAADKAWPGSTLHALRFYARQYGFREESDVQMGPENSSDEVNPYYWTRLPIPVDDTGDIL